MGYMNKYNDQNTVIYITCEKDPYFLTLFLSQAENYYFEAGSFHLSDELSLQCH